MSVSSPSSIPSTKIFYVQRSKDVEGNTYLDVIFTSKEDTYVNKCPQEN